MNAGGLLVTVAINSSVYYFDNMRISVSSRMEDTSLIDGGLLRVRSGIFSELIYLKKRLKYTEISEYRSFMEGIVACDSVSVTINGMSFSEVAALNAKISFSEGEPFADFELTFVRVDN